MPEAEQVADDKARDRWSEIHDALALVGVSFVPDEVFETPTTQPDRHTIRVATKQNTRVRIAVVEDVHDLIDGKVLLDIREEYSYHDLACEQTRPLRLTKYPYWLSYFPEIVI